MPFLTAEEVREVLVAQCRELGCTCEPTITVHSADGGAFMHANAAHARGCPADNAPPEVMVNDA